MLFEDQIDQLKEGLQILQARVQESSAFNKAFERYNSLSPIFQKFLLGAGAFVVIFLILAAPIAKYKTSTEEVASFEEQKNLTQKVINFSKKSSSLSPQPKKFSTSELEQRVQALSKSYSINLLQEQTFVDSRGADKKLIPKANQVNFSIKANKANIDQITALAYSVKKLNKSLQITGLNFQANRENPLYFDGSIEVANLSVQPISAVLPKPELNSESKKKKKRRGRR